MTIGLTFSFSLILSPLLNDVMGVKGIFALTGILSMIAILLVRFIIPNPAITHFHSDTQASSKKFAEVLRNKDLLRLDFGIFSLHAILMSVFMQVPFVLKANGLDVAQHWKIYLPVMLIAFVLMVPPIIIAEKKAKMKQVFMLAIALALGAQMLLLAGQHSLWMVAAALLVFFTAFNVLEATLPSLISKIAPLSAKGTAMGVYSSVQFLGAFFGAIAGGALMQYVSHDSVLFFSIGLLFLWLIVASTMRPPLAVSTKLYHLDPLTEADAVQLQQQLAALQGVHEVLVIASESIACLKVEMQGFDENGIQQLVLKGK
jgi:predicted MFS family arabinose efflux permease